MIDQRADEVADRLLAYLQAALGDLNLQYAEPPLPVSGGFETRIYSFQLRGGPEGFSRPLILRLFREGEEPARARWEETVHTALVELGYPAPRVLLAATEKETLGGAFVVMERLPGKLMLEDIALSRPLVQLPRILTGVPRVLAEWQAKLHALDPERLLRALDAAGLPAGGVGPAGVSWRVATVEGRLDQIQRRIDRASLGGLKPGIEWLLEHRPPEPDRQVICHGDFHPLNVLMVGDRVSGVIDWPMVAVGDPAFDVGNTRVLLGLAPMELPAALDWVTGAIRPILVRRYYDAYQRHRVLDRRAVRYYEALRCVQELVWVGEWRLAAPDVIEARWGRNPWAAPRPTRRLLSHFHKIAGVELRLPSMT